MLRKSLIIVFVALVAISGAALAYAPYLPRLLAEGYPSPIWPSQGDYATIEGASSPLPLQIGANASRRALPKRLTELFDASGGKALLVSRGERLELEHYAEGVAPGTKFNSFSMAKSLVGALIFKALADGKLSGLDAAVGQFLPGYGDKAFRGVTVRELLQMRGGVLFERDDPLKAGQTKDLEATIVNPFGPMARLHVSGLDAIRTRLTADPALIGRFSYQNVNTAILAAILEKLYGRSVAELISTKLWAPAGAGPGYWRRYTENGAVSAYCCIFATARDWIRIGRYLLRNGTPSAPFLPEPSWRQFMGLNLGQSALHKGVYGYHMRHDMLDRPGQALQGPFAYMLGQGGQVLYMLPGHDLVVLRFGERMQLLHSTLYAAWTAIGRPSAK